MNLIGLREVLKIRLVNFLKLVIINKEKIIILYFFKMKISKLNMKNDISSLVKGFTLIELLIVIAIIALLASVVLVSFPSSTAKSRDSNRIQELKQIQTALRLYYDINHEMPGEVGIKYCDDGPNFLQELVDGNFFPYNPKSVSGSIESRYCYYDYGPDDDDDAGALLWVNLESYEGTTGFEGTCRPFPAGADWCGQDNNNFYCLCTPYSPYW